MIAAPPTLDYYLGLITSEHSGKPKFMAVVAAEIQPYVDLQQTLWKMLGLFTPNATGAALDKVGARIGASRNLATPLQDVFFSWDAPGQGWDQGTLIGPNDDPNVGLAVLPDDTFQLLVKIVIAQNNWDGTIPGVYAVWGSIFGDANRILIQDNQDMTMFVTFLDYLSVVEKTLITGGYFNLRPAGVRIAGFFQPSVSGQPIFGFDAQNSTISGWDTGCFMEPL